MNRVRLIYLVIGLLGLVSVTCGPDEPVEEARDVTITSPADELPPHITQIAYYGQRADWSHDGKRILFLEKTFGDVFEIDLETKTIRPISHHYFHEGYTRALYLSNGDIILSGAPDFDAEDPWRSRRETAELMVLSKDLDKPPVPLGTRCSEGPAVSRKELKIAWTITDDQYPEELPEGGAQIWMADIVYEDGTPQLANKKLVLDNQDLDFETGLETQNFRPPDERELIFSAYGYQKTEVMGVMIETGEITHNYSQSPDTYEEPEGIFPTGEYTLVESDRHRGGGGSQYIDIHKLKLDGSAEFERLTFFNDERGFKATNPVVSDDGRYMAFQMAKVGDRAGIGRGLFIYDFSKVGAGAGE